MQFWPESITVVFFSLQTGEMEVKNPLFDDSTLHSQRNHKWPGHTHTHTQHSQRNHKWPGHTHTHTHNPVYFNNRLNTPKSTLWLGEVAPHTNDDIQPHMERNKLWLCFSWNVPAPLRTKSKNTQTLKMPKKGWSVDEWWMVNKVKGSSC